MAYLTQFYTNPLLGQNINAALLVGTFTNTTRIRKFWINVFLDGVAGGATGDYYAYVTWQRAGAGNFHESIRTSKPAAVGTTSIVFNTMTLTTSTATDVIRVYVLGLAGDNISAVNTIVDVNEEWIDIDANGRVDVGEWLGTAPAALTASGFVQAMLLRWLTDNAAGTPLALSANKVQTVDSTVPSANAVADQVWDEAIAGHVAAGSTGKALTDLAPGAAIVLNADITEIHT